MDGVLNLTMGGINLTIDGLFSGTPFVTMESYGRDFTINGTDVTCQERQCPVCSPKPEWFLVQTLVSFIVISAMAIVMACIMGFTWQTIYAHAIRDALNHQGDKVEWLLKEKTRLKRLRVPISWKLVKETPPEALLRDNDEF